MKRKVSILLSFIIIFVLVMPVWGITADVDKGLEKAIKIAKTKFAIPDDYKFTSSIGTSGNKEVYHLSWNSKDTVDATYIYVTIDENGMIIDYSKYTRDDYKTAKKLPKLSRKEAREKAEAHIELIAPGLMKELREEDYYYQGNILDSSYFFNYYRVVNGIPFYSDRVYVNVNRDTGALLSYSRQWSDIKSFPPPDEVLSLKDAEQAYAQNLGMRLVYKYTKKDKELSAYLAYIPFYDNSLYGVDAFTGERRRVSGGYSVTYADGAGGSVQKKESLATMDEGAVRLSPEEQEAVREAAKLISREDAEKIAREAEFLGISGNHKLQGYNLNTSWVDEREYVWSLYFRKPSEDTAVNDYVNVTINAKTGEITSFHRRAPEPGSAKPQKSLAAVKAEVDVFLKKYYPKYYSQLEYDNMTSEGSATGTTPEREYSLVYSRLVNGIAFPDNGVNVYYDNVNGMIVNFYLNWYDIEFPEDKVIGAEEACKKIFENVGLELQYRYDYLETAKYIYPPDVPENAKTTLVYVLKSGKPLVIGATNGKLLDSDGTEYKEPAKISYTDIKGHAAEKQITVLAENGIHLGGTEFKPDTLITQLDFLTLLSKTMNYYGPVVEERTDKGIDDLYAYMMIEGVIKEGERAPQNNVTREEAVKYLVRALKFDRVADIKGIFNIGFKDKDGISPGLEGYAVIAAGLGIVEGGNVDFRPKDKITRGESAVMIYNYLQI